MSVFDGAESDILQPEDIAEIAETLNSGGVAIAVVYEDRSLAAAAHAWRSAGGELLWSGGIAIDDLEHALAEPTNEEN
ncbi:MAG: hypothetical protein ABI310_07910 [Microbacteriaceae bacterium]